MKFLKPIFSNGLLDAFHKVHVVEKIVDRIEPRREDFICKIEMAEISPRIVAAGIAKTIFVDGPPVFQVLGLLDGDLA